VTRSKLSQSVAHVEEYRVREDEDRSGVRASKMIEHRTDLVRSNDVSNADLKPRRRRR
jgi:hypothetical protein